MNTFKVSDVKLGRSVKNTSPLKEVITGLVNVTPEACSANQEKVIAVNTNSFIAAVHLAFAEHYPLTISPDDVWLCISQGFANHVNANAEALRKQFVQHEGKELIRIECPGFVKGSATNPWEGVFPQFSDKIAEYIGKKRDLVVANFSTTNLIEKVASEIVLMDAMKQYFDYRCRTMCGIPEIILLGTVEDWKNIKARAAVLAEFDLKWWIDNLLPVLDKFIDAASNKIDKDFWQSFYKISGGSGGPFTNGWINILFPYLEDYETSAYTRKNKSVEECGSNNVFYHGPSTDEFPVGLSKVPFIWEYYDKNFNMQFLGGFVGVSQDKDSLIVRPAIGWAVSDVVKEEKKNE